MDSGAVADTKPQDYGALVIQQVNNIHLLSSKEYHNREDKLFDFTWSVRMLKQTITEEKQDEQFQKEYEDWLKNHYTLVEFIDKFNSVMELFGICMNCLGRNGLLYRKVKSGTY